MKYRRRQNGLTLTELIVVVAVMAILLGISVPTAKKLIDSFEHSAGARSLINAALSSARAMAVSKGKYIGIRFQQDREGNQYMIFIEHDPPGPPDDAILAYGFRAVKGRKPMRLPKHVGVMDGIYVNRTYQVGPLGETSVTYNDLHFNVPMNDADIFLRDSVPAYLQDGRNIWYTDATTFSIVFSSSGHVLIHEIWVSNKEMVTDRPGETRAHVDTLFNWKDTVDTGNAMFYQDDYGQWPASRYTQDRGIGPEKSRQSFIIYNKKQLSETDPTARWSGYLGLLQPEFVNPYSGQLIKK